jgi:hypothetical protein
MQGMPVQSTILSPAPGDLVTPDPVTGCVEVTGYVWSGSGAGVVRVEVSGDGGWSWVSGELVNPRGRVQPAGRAWAWVLWRAEVPVVQGTTAAVTKVGQIVKNGLGAGVRGEAVGSANKGGELGLKGFEAPGGAAPRAEEGTSSAEGGMCTSDTMGDIGDTVGDTSIKPQTHQALGKPGNGEDKGRGICGGCGVRHECCCCWWWCW